MRQSLWWSRCLALAVGLGLLAAAGCGPSAATLTGKVTYKGAALKGGNVTLIPDGSGETFSAPIQEDGRYKFEQLKSGKYKIVVETDSLKPPPQRGPKLSKNIENKPPAGANIPEGAGYKMAPPAGQVAAENARKYVPIPANYADPAQSGLSLEVKGGSNTHDITLN
jgi:hypothetical protein